MVGRILDELHRLGRADDTLVIFTSDHGEMGGSHGYMNKGRWHEESVRVPMIVRSPGSPTGTHIDTPVSAGVDIWPTMLDWVGASADSEVSGESLIPLVGSGTDGDHHSVFSEMAGNYDWLMVRDGAWKYVVTRSTGEPLALHNLHDDPLELTNRLGDAPADVLAHLHGQTEQFRAETALGPPAQP